MKRFSPQKRWFLATTLLAIPVLLFVFRTNILTALGSFLVVEDKLERADMIFLLNGDTTTRPFYASQLFHRNLAPNVGIARMEDSEGVKLGAYPNPTDSNIIVLKQTGVPEDHIVQLRPPDGVMHTIDEANALRTYVEHTAVHRVIIVTSDLHSRRSRYTFRKALSGTGVEVLMAPTPDLKYGAKNWWHSEDGIIGLQNEYIKLFYYYYRY
jgi:uncharacterized SAM-binding protein YcdF (DUF218 family)